MYDEKDPRAALASKSGPADSAERIDAQFGLFYETQPTITEASSQTWLTRGQNLVVAYTQAKAGAQLIRKDQKDEYFLVLPDKDIGATIEAAGDTQEVEGHSVVIIPPGASKITLKGDGRLARIFSAQSDDLNALCSNQEAYRAPTPHIPPYAPWPAPTDGYAIRAYSLDVAPEPGRFGRIFRSSTLMVNVLDPQMGPRDVGKLSPHHHDDFEQGSLALDGSFTHHLRWTWGTNMNLWRDDLHALCKSPSLAIIPPPLIHTSRGMDDGLNQLVDIFSPPRHDFSAQEGWVLNADEYPIPDK